jgi:hypothetical protein
MTVPRRTAQGAPVRHSLAPITGWPAPDRGQAVVPHPPCALGHANDFALSPLAFRDHDARARARVMGITWTPGGGTVRVKKMSHATWKAGDSPPRRKDSPRCQSRTRAGGACLVRVEPGKARCRFHGGLSTGPRTEEGRARISEAQQHRWRAYRASKAT